MSSRITAITSSAGGVGKTTVALNVASYLKNQKKRVLLIDLSLYGGVDVVVRKSKKTTGLGSLYSLFEQDKPLDINKAIIFDDATIGCDLLINTTALTMEKMNCDFVDQLFKTIYLADYDEVIVDTSSELSERNSKLFQLSDQILYIVTQDVSVCWRTIKHMEILEKLQIDRGKIRTVMNRYRKDIVFNIAELEEEGKIIVHGTILDKKSEITNLHNSGKISLQNSISKFSRNLKKLFDEIWRCE